MDGRRMARHKKSPALAAAELKIDWLKFVVCKKSFVIGTIIIPHTHKNILIWVAVNLCDLHE